MDFVPLKSKMSSSSPLFEEDGGGKSRSITLKKSPDPCCSSHPAVDADGDRVICQSRTTTEQGKIDENNRFFPVDSLQTARKAATERLLEQKKLVLVLDIDHTLLHTILPSGNHDNNGAGKAGDRTSFTGEEAPVTFRTRKTMVRPFVHSFLKRVSPMYEMYLYTHGNLLYAENMKKILDPDDFYFKNKLITREDSVRNGSDKFKHMDLVVADTNLIVVIDDNPYMWIDHAGNVIHIKKYEFPHCNNSDGGDDTLQHMHLLLHRIYSQFYNSTGHETEDVRKVMQTLRRETLKDCKIIISIIGRCSNKGDDSSRHLVEIMGGSCCKEISEEVTHVVVVGSSSSELNQDLVIDWAVDNHKFVVSKDWLESAYYSWTRPNENNFTFSSLRITSLALD